MNTIIVDRIGCDEDEQGDATVDFDDPSLHRLLDDAEALAHSLNEHRVPKRPLPDSFNDEAAAAKQLRSSPAVADEPATEEQSGTSSAALNEHRVRKRPLPDSFNDEGHSSVALLSSLNAKELVVKIIARNRRKALSQARGSATLEQVRRELAGARGRSDCLDALERLHPDLGDKMERIIEQMDIGADAHRRDAAFTLTSATKRTKGNGYVRIANELKTQFGIEVSPQGVQRMGIARNKRSRVAQRYRALVQMKYRRSVKRVAEVKLDTRASRAYYRTYHSGIRDKCSQTDVASFERDDHAKIRMNSSSTTNQHATITNDEGAGAVQHDYNDPKLCSSLYITSIRGAPLADGVEINIALVKVDKLQPSTATQHYCDLYMLQALNDPRTATLFRTPDGGYKQVVQAEVDGGPDEGPTHAEVQFLQSEFAMGGPKLKPEQRRAQAGTCTRCPNDSPLNFVERQNGQETETLATLYCGTDACGSLLDDQGLLEESKLHSMWNYHADKIVRILNGSTGLNGSTMLALRGATAESCEEAKILLERRDLLLLYIKPGQSKKMLAQLKRDHPAEVAHFECVLAFQRHTQRAERYNATNSPAVLCGERNCKHCHFAPSVSTWFKGGPKLAPIPPPYRDANRPGHRMQPADALSTYASLRCSTQNTDGKCFTWPSEEARESFVKFTADKPLAPFPEDKLEAVVDRIGDSSITCEVLKKSFTHMRHVRLHRLLGAQKAQATKKANKAKRAAAVAAPAGTKKANKAKCAAAVPAPAGTAAAAPAPAAATATAAAAPAPAAATISVTIQDMTGPTTAVSIEPHASTVELAAAIQAQWPGLIIMTFPGGVIRRLPFREEKLQTLNVVHGATVHVTISPTACPGAYVTTSSLNGETMWHGVGHHQYDAAAASLGLHELETRLASPMYLCSRPELGGITRSNCRYPFTCCSTRRPTVACPLLKPGYPLPVAESPPATVVTAPAPAPAVTVEPPAATEPPAAARPPAAANMTAAGVPLAVANRPVRLGAWPGPPRGEGH